MFLVCFLLIHLLTVELFQLPFGAYLLLFLLPYCCFLLPFRRFLVTFHCFLVTFHCFLVT